MGPGIFLVTYNVILLCNFKKFEFAGGGGLWTPPLDLRKALRC